MYEYVIARTKYFDNICLDAINNNIEQIVLLGAGYDSRPYRFCKSIINTKIYELDTKPTQVYKLSCLQKNNIEIHPNICYASVNFETDDPIAALCGCGYEREKQTLFMWEGVTFYLSKDTVTKMLHMINKNSPYGSRVCFDFQTVHNDRDLINTGLKDEVIKFGIESGKITNFMNEQNYRVIEHITAGLMEERFLALKNGGSIGKIAPIMNFILAEHD
jgi:methyltransferase (TIGR00027 family)